MRTALFALAALIILHSPAGAQDRRELTIGITQYPATLHPMIDSMVAKSYVLGLMRRPITVYDQDWNLTCMLCEDLPVMEEGTARIETLEDGSQRVAADFTIREGVRWGDGTPVTTADVLFTWQVGRHPDTGVAAASLYNRFITDITVHDARRFTIHWDKVRCSYDALSDFNLLPAHLERETFEADPANYRNTTLYDTAPETPGLWMGPYRMATRETGAFFRLERNPEWWGKAPHFDEITIRVIENTAALEAAILSGSIDMIAGELGLTLDQAVNFENRHGRKFNVIYKPGLIYEHIDLNLDNPLLQDVRVRRALLHSIDRDAISTQLFGGRQPTAHSNINPLDRVHTHEIRKYSYDPDRAAELLDAAGYTQRGRGGVRIHETTGEALSLSIMTTSGNRSRELVQQVLQDQWRQVGIDVRIENQPARVLFGETTTKRKFDSMVMYAWMSAPENIPRSTLHSDEIPSAANAWAGQNYPGFANAQMDQVLEDLDTVCEPQANLALWHQAQAIYAEELPVLPLYFRSNPFILPKWLTGLRPTGHQYPSTLWAEEWGVE